MKSILWREEQLHLLDQRLLPEQEKWITCQNVQQVLQAG